MSESIDSQFPTLEKPPITEVVCGIKFERMSSFDSAAQGLFWSRIKDRFPRKAIREPLANSGAIEIAFGPRMTPRVRTWLLTEDDAFVLQLQDDVLYLNWRKRDQQYPRFHSTESTEGILPRVLHWFHKFTEFCRVELDAKPSIQGIELAKINQLISGEHWSSRGELVELLPSLSGAEHLMSESRPDFNLRFAGESRSNEGTFLCVFRTGEVESATDSHKAAVNIELRTRREVSASSDLSVTFNAANKQLNTLFFEEIIPDASSRF